MRALQNLIKALLLVTLLFTVVFLASADSVYNIEGNFTTEEKHNFTFTNKTNINSANITLKSPGSQVLTEKLIREDNELKTSISDNFFDEEGVYHFTFKIDGKKLPSKGYHSMIIGGGNQSFYNEFSEFGNKRPNSSEGSLCSEEDDFSCEYEHYQASMMLKAVEAYRIKSEPSLKEEALNFSTKAYGSTQTQIACPHTSGEFDCFTGAGNPSGAVRQGSLIEGLWEVYSVTGNETVENLARNYTEEEFGDSSCDVWNNQYDCGSSRGKGYLAKGFWTAYEATGDGEFREIAVNLTDFNKSHPKMTQAYADAYRLTENESYKDNLKQSFDEQYLYCRNNNCSKIRELELAKAGIEGYKATGDTGFYVGSILSAPENCGGYRCDLPNEQGKSGVVSSYIYRSFYEEEKKFFNPKILETPSNGESLRVEIDFSGIVNNSKATLYNSEKDLLESCDLGLGTKSCTFNHTWQDQQVYYFNFSSNKLRFPNGVLPVTYTQKDQDIEQDALNLASGSPSRNCDPFKSNFSCVDIGSSPYERDQSSYILGLSNTYDHTRNTTYLDFAKELSTPPYYYNQQEDEDEQQELCIPDHNISGEEYRCDTFNSILAGQRQGKFIEALFESYSITNNETIRTLAKNYADRSVIDGNDCQVWQGEFECRIEETEESQSSMIDGYWTAYKVTGNETYRDIAQNLTEGGIKHSSDPSSYSLASSLWKAYTVTGNVTYRESAHNMTNNLTNESCNNCELETYIARGDMLIDGYRATGNDSYIEDMESHLDSRSNFSCISTGNCGNPMLQGKAISFMTRSAYNYPLSIGLERSISVEKNEITVGDSVDVVCEAENVLANSTVPSLSLNVTSDSLFGSEHFEYDIGDMEYGDSNTTNSTFTSIETGTSEVSCEYTSPEFNRTSTETIKIVSEQSSDDGSEDEEDNENTDSENDDGGSSGSSPGNSQGNQDGESSANPETLEYEYSYKEYNHTNLGLDEQYRYHRIFSDSCIEASRIFKEERTVLNISQSCENKTDIAVRDRFNETNRDKVLSNVSSNIKQIVYPFKSNKNNWSRPEIALLSERDIEINTGIAGYTESSENSYTVDLDLNRPEECTVYRNQSAISTKSSLNQSHNITLLQGINNISVRCGTQSQSYIVNHEKEDKGSPLWMYAAFIMSIASVSTALIRRQKILTLVKIKIFDYYFNRVMNAVQDGNSDAAVKYYKRMSKYCEFPEANSDFAAQEGLKLFMMVDLISDAGTEIGNAELVGDVKTSLSRYLSENPDTPLANHIKDKIRDIRIS